MSKPLLLDLFCGAGGASMGYAQAGFRVVGVDNRAQPNYPFEFRRASAFALPFPLRRFDAIHASPPCQAYSVANNIHGKAHPDYVAIVRQMLTESGVPWVIENVPGAPLRDAVTLCGRAFGLAVKRHRLFESPVPIEPTVCPPGHPGGWVSVYGNCVLERGTVTGRARGGGNRITRRGVDVERGRRSMGIDWMTVDELSQAIPPAYTRHVGAALLAA